MAHADTHVQVEDAQSFKAGGKPPLYAARKRVYPKAVAGTFRRVKWVALLVLLGIYYTVPWLRWDRGLGVPDQAVLIDLPARRAYFFFIEIWPQEVYYVTGLLIMAALGLFLVTSLAGRVWCGYACPQTVWTDLFMWIERKIEGDRNSRIKLDKAGISPVKLRKKILKHGAWLVIAFLTGGAWVLYFNDAPTVFPEIFTGAASTRVYFFIGLFTFTTYTLAGWAREQVCTYMCPWPRFQSAMFDENTLIVTYEEWRGEPRGRHIKGESWEKRGDCVDCNQCVAVCPMGIDIRDGNQLECIGCGLCIDACNSVMEKVGRPRDLITLDTTANQVSRARGGTAPYRLFRFRTVAYALVLVAVGAFMVYSLATRPSLHVNALHDRAPLFVPLSDGSVRNGYTLKVSNMRHGARQFNLTLEGIPGARFTVIGTDAKEMQGAMLPVGRDEVGTFRVFVTVAPAQLKAESMPLIFRVTDLNTGETDEYHSVFRGPRR